MEKPSELIVSANKDMAGQTVRQHPRELERKARVPRTLEPLSEV